MKLIMLGSGTSTGVPRIGNDWGLCDPAQPRNRRTRVSIIVENKAGAARDIVTLNAGVALYAANVAPSMADGIAKARAAIESGAARRCFDAFVAATQKWGAA